MNRLPSCLLVEAFLFSRTLDLFSTFVYVCRSWNNLLKSPSVWKRKWVSFQSINVLRKYVKHQKSFQFRRIQILFSLYAVELTDFDIFKNLLNLEEIKFLCEMNEQHFLLLHSFHLPITCIYLLNKFSQASFQKLNQFKMKTLRFKTYNFLCYPPEFSKFEFLKTLSLSFITLSLKPFFLSLPLSLEKLSLVQIKIVKKYRSLTLLHRLPNLRILQLHHIDQSLNEFQSLYRLRSLSLSHYSLNDKHLEELKFLENLQEFKVQKEIHHFFPFCNLTYLQMMGLISPLSIVSKFASLSKLKILYLNFDQYEQNVLESLHKLISLQTLHICYNASNGLNFSLQPLTNMLIQNLILSSDDRMTFAVEQDSVIYGSFPNLPNLISLKFQHLNIDDHLFELLPCFPFVSSLDLWGCNNLTNKSINNIIKKFPSLTHLILKHTSITKIPKFLGHKHLYFIQVSENVKRDEKCQSKFILYI